MAGSASPHEGCAGTPPDACKTTTNDCGTTPPASCGGGFPGAACEPCEAGRDVREPSFVTRERLPASVGDGTLSCNLSQQVRAYLPPPANCGGALRGVLARPIRHKPVRRYRGAPSIARWGWASGPIPWRQAKRAAPQARRREGLMPNGRDGEGGTGRSPKARRREAPTRPAGILHAGALPVPGDPIHCA
jgi:hypothetical protein